MLQLHFLGRPRITLDGEPVDDFVSVKALTLLAYLAMGEGAHPRGTLAGLFWGEKPEKRARANLRMALYNLQQLLPGYFEATRKTVSFNRERPHYLDVAVFETGIEAAEASSDARSMHAAVEVYRGHFLEGVHVAGGAAIQEWVRSHRERLRLRLLTALEKLAGHYTAGGDWDAAIDVVRRLLAVEPWRETSHRQLMRLLARTGQHSAALAQYETCRQVLAAELGIEPMPATTALYRRIQHVRTRPRRRTLPAHPTGFVGREDELSRLHAMLANPSQRLITVVGPGGIGKTRLAVEATVHHVHTFLDGVAFVPLADLDDPTELPPAIAAALDLPLHGQVSPRLQLIEYLRRRELLLVLDNFEHLLAGADLVTQVLEEAPAVNLLVTSRERLNLRWESLLPLDGLAYSRNGTVEGLAAYAAAQLFQQSAGRHQPDFVLSEANRAAVARICKLTEGLPLALELAAARVPAESCATIAGAIEGNLNVLATSMQDVPGRHRSVQAAFEHSWDLLTKEEQSVYQKLSVFRGGFGAEAAQDVAGASRRLLAGLVLQRDFTRVD